MTRWLRRLKGRFDRFRVEAPGFVLLRAARRRTSSMACIDLRALRPQAPSSSL